MQSSRMSQKRKRQDQRLEERFADVVVRELQKHGSDGVAVSQLAPVIYGCGACGREEARHHVSRAGGMRKWLELHLEGRIQIVLRRGGVFAVQLVNQTRQPASRSRTQSVLSEPTCF